jgi:hypothetical protein
MKTDLLSMGFIDTQIDEAIGALGADSIERVIEGILKLQSGESLDSLRPSPSAVPQISQEEREAHLNELKARAEARKAQSEAVKPKQDASDELKRRKEVLDQVEMKKKYDDTKAELERKAAERERIQDKLARERVKQKIAAQRKVTNPDPAPAPPPQVNVGEKRSEVVIRFNYPGLKVAILNFEGSKTLRDADRELKAKNPELVGKLLSYEMFGAVKVSFGMSDMGKSLRDLGLSGRVSLNVCVAG